MIEGIRRRKQERDRGFEENWRRTREGLAAGRYYG